MTYRPWFAAALLWALACRSTPEGAPCGPALEPKCGPDQYCDYQPDLCGEAEKPGQCRARPITCDTAQEPICGCDGKVYDNACALHSAGLDVNVNGGCGDVVEGRIACGAHYCDTTTSYCEIVLSDVRELPSDYTCRPLPKACTRQELATTGDPCDCFPPSTRCVDFCSPVKTGSFRLTCVGGY